MLKYDDNLPKNSNLFSFFLNFVTFLATNTKKRELLPKFPFFCKFAVGRLCLCSHGKNHLSTEIESDTCSDHNQ